MGRGLLMCVALIKGDVVQVLLLYYDSNTCRYMVCNDATQTIIIKSVYNEYNSRCQQCTRAHFD
jgi:hypothetical protein